MTFKHSLRFLLAGLCVSSFVTTSSFARTFLDGDLNIQTYDYEQSLLKQGDPHGTHEVKVRDYNGKEHTEQIKAEIRISPKPNVLKEVKFAEIYGVQVNNGFCHVFKLYKTAEATGIETSEFPSQDRKEKGKSVTLIGKGFQPQLVLETDCKQDELEKVSIFGEFDGTGFLTLYKFKKSQ
ncbi:hypothetical protein [Helicobacter cetorum]|uniref:Uncharacterized protein n=1 Tax=Helicobacter cetorum (strain ATCC BAA-429 / MIT 00-7128) TaxID=182217 RepID=I0EPB3_HELC0|nr:hypothetical protein [Helicobacter cetorum]AFI04782.1 hypothetical protein HCW_07620 [Helicobacter cetorum MIT 00-7128]